MANIGKDIVDLAVTCLGQKYVLGAVVPKDNPNWKGPWDCAEFASWCAYQAYGIVFGMRPRRADAGDAYSGSWFEDANQPGVAISVADALKIPGALLVRKPRPKVIGHVAICVGDGDQTIEARGAKFGVGRFKGAANRPWDVGVLLPGVDYEHDAPGQHIDTDPDFVPKPQKLPPNYFGYQVPNQTGPVVLEIQKAMKAAGFDPGPLDGELGLMTDAAIASFQATSGLEQDGIVGPQTAGSLGLTFPIVATPASIAEFQALRQKRTNPPPPPPPPPPGSAMSILGFSVDAGKYTAILSDGTKQYVGSAVNYSDDMHRVGLWQDRNLKLVEPIGVYKAADFLAAHGKFAHFIRPTVMAESGGLFGRVNSYDRAAFTFGAPQLAAHTPGENLILLFRSLLGLPNAANFFPELSLVGNKVTLTKPGGSKIDLEAAIQVVRPNGKTETQLKNFMEYLNSDPQQVDTAELTAAARLMLWAKADPKARDAQIALLVQRAKNLIAEAKTKLNRFDGTDWRIALWIVDIRYQGRGTYSAIRECLASGDPLAALGQVGGGSYAGRLKTVADTIADMEASGVLNGFTV